MAHWRFYRRAHIFPGLTANLSRSGPSLSLGVAGAHVTVGPRGVTRTVGIPGSGIYWTSHTGHHSGVHSAHVDGPVSTGAQRSADVGCAVLVIAVVAGLVLVGLAAAGAIVLLVVRG